VYFLLYQLSRYICSITEGLKRFVSIVFTAIATLVLFVFAVVPHHHHGGMPCFVMERCEQGDVNHHDHCIMETGYVLSLTGNEVKCKVSSCDDTHSHIHFFPILCTPADLLVPDTEPPVIKHAYGEYLFFCKPIDASLNNGLRAPPV
jgi:hypothetical protein